MNNKINAVARYQKHIFICMHFRQPSWLCNKFYTKRAWMDLLFMSFGFLFSQILIFTLIATLYIQWLLFSCALYDDKCLQNYAQFTQWFWLSYNVISVRVKVGQEKLLSIIPRVTVIDDEVIFIALAKLIFCLFIFSFLSLGSSLLSSFHTKKFEI